MGLQLGAFWSRQSGSVSNSGGSDGHGDIRHFAHVNLGQSATLSFRTPLGDPNGELKCLKSQRAGPSNFAEAPDRDATKARFGPFVRLL